MNRSTVVLAAILALCSAVPFTNGDKITLSFDSLPSSQGFTYDYPGNPVPEGDIFSVDGIALTQNTIGQPLISPAHNIYRLDGIVNDHDPFSLDVRARMIADEPLDAIGFFMSVRTGTERNEIFLGTSTIHGPTRVFVTSAIDTSVFHDYRIEGTPGDDTFAFFVDDALIADVISSSDTNDNYIGLGDPTGNGGNAHVEVTRFEFCQPSCDILEPTTIALDIKPGSFPNSVNLTDKGVLPVAILGTDDFDVTEMDFDSLRFGDPNGGTAVRPLRSALEDVSGDGIWDLSLKFSMAEMVESEALGPNTSEGVLTGALRDGTPFVGMDSIRIVPPNGSQGNSLRVSAVPEPATGILLLFGVMTMVCRRNQSCTEKRPINRKRRNP
jgi:hypothetical protein